MPPRSGCARRWRFADGPPTYTPAIMPPRTCTAADGKGGRWESGCLFRAPEGTHAADAAVAAAPASSTPCPAVRTCAWDRPPGLQDAIAHDHILLGGQQAAVFASPRAQVALHHLYRTTLVKSLIQHRSCYHIQHRRCQQAPWLQAQERHCRCRLRPAGGRHVGPEHGDHRWRCSPQGPALAIYKHFTHSRSN